MDFMVIHIIINNIPKTILKFINKNTSYQSDSKKNSIYKLDLKLF